MLVREVVCGVFQIGLGSVNVFLVEPGDGSGRLALIDAGMESDVKAVVRGIESVGRTPGEITDIVVTHAHYDHAGGLAELKRLTGATVWMFPSEAEAVRAGQARPQAKSATPGLMNAVMRMAIQQAPRDLPPCEVEREVADGEMIPVAGGMDVILAPGHTDGHVVLLWPEQGGVLFCGDMCGHSGGLAPSLFNDDPDGAIATLRKVCNLDFEVACFAHGGPITTGAAEAFRKKWDRRRVRRLAVATA
jgi:glyoxylase-like metal-dependent hydrolase (beta-lactamase superfamily II)